MIKKKMDFEASLDRIAEISEYLEKEELKLEDSMNLYKEAMTLINDCKDQLERAEREIYILRETPEDINNEEDSKQLDDDKNTKVSKKTKKTKKKMKSQNKEKDISFELFSDIESLDNNDNDIENK
jgi:exodeoxyribonuclease VII small subunit